MKRLFALRGAVRAVNNENDIKIRSITLYDELLKKNSLDEKDIVSVVFSMTKDLDARNPASALREEGRAADAALFVVQEAAIIGAMEGVIRILIHCNLDEGSVPVHVYQNGAELLRPDRQKQ